MQKAGPPNTVETCYEVFLHIASMLDLHQVAFLLGTKCVAKLREASRDATSASDEVVKVYLHADVSFLPSGYPSYCMLI